MSEIHARRRTRAWADLSSTQPDADTFLITGLTNVRYLTGFSGSNAIVLLAADEALLATDGRYVLQAGAECPDLPLVVDRSTLTAAVHAWLARDAACLAVESDHLTVAQWRQVRSVLGPTREVVEAQGIVETVRTVKDSGELALIAEACAISDEALAVTLSTIRPGDTERDIAQRLDAAMVKLGADRPAFDTIVAAGPHSAIPHHQPTDRPIERGDLLLIDFGAEVAGYHADETRTFAIGAPAQWQKDLHALVLAAQSAGREMTTVGASLAGIDEAARSVIVAAGHGDDFGHGLGHGVGLQIHEAPFLSARATGMLLADSPVTIEPGVYLGGRGGVRIEDTTVVSQGQTISLTVTDRGLQELT